MQPPRQPESAASPARTRTIRYEDWRGRIQTATDLDQLVGAVKAYLAEWQPSELGMLPPDLGLRGVSTSEEIVLRAVAAAHAELKVPHDAPSAPLLREMSLTLMAAASRLRFLTALRTRESGR